MLFTWPQWLNDIVEPLKSGYKQSLWLSLGINVIALLSSIFALQVYDRVVAKGGLNTLTALGLGMLIAIAFDVLLRQGRSLLLRKIGINIETSIAKQVFQRMMELPARFLEKRPPAFWTATFRDIELLRSTMAGAPALLLIELPFLILTFVLLAVIATPLLPVVFGVLLVFMILAWRSQQTLQYTAEGEKEKLLSRDAMLAELTHSRTQIKALGPTPLLDQKWQHHYAQWMEESVQRSAEADQYRDYAQDLMLLSTVLMTTFGAIAILNQELSIGALIAANILSGKMVGPMVQLVSHWRTYGQFQHAQQRLTELFDQPLDLQETALEFTRPKGIMTLEKVTFGYVDGQKPHVFEVSGRLGPTGLHTIIGNNGSGKTTLLKLLRGLYTPVEGRVLIDDIDLVQLGQQSIADWIAYLPQQPRLIDSSIKECLTMHMPSATDADILQATKASGAYDFITQLPEGFDTQVGEAGNVFSSGQIKRIALAQVLIKNTPVLLLDEPTSDIDKPTEQHLLRTLCELSKTRTIIIVTHSTAILQSADGIVLMENSQVVGAGPGEQLRPKLGLASEKVLPGAAS